MATRLDEIKNFHPEARSGPVVMPSLRAVRRGFDGVIGGPMSTPLQMARSTPDPWRPLPRSPLSIRVNSLNR